VRGSGYNQAVEGYQKKMAELGYIEGENVVYDIRFVSKKEELPNVAKSFVEEGVDLIHVYSTPATKAVYEVTKDMEKPIPVVFGSMGDPLASGTVKDIQHSGTNVTGVASLSTELTAKRVEFITELVPDAKRIAMPHTAREAGDIAANLSVDIALETADRLGVEVVPLPVVDKTDNARVAKLITSDKYDGIVVGGDSLIWGSLDLYISQAIQEKLPLAVFSVGQVSKGALVGYGPDYAISGRQSAVLTDKILKGQKPTDLPIEVPQRLVVVVNKSTADAIGLKLDPEFLSKVDIVVE
jgi:putative ABC transport system substrate-binding protein